VVRLTRSAIALFAGVWVSVAFAAGPRVLIVQSMVPVKRGEDDTNRPLANFLASQFDESAKLEAIVYSLADPVYRNAALEAKLADPKVNVSLDDSHTL
jgi:hypothetical protein